MDRPRAEIYSYDFCLRSTFTQSECFEAGAAASNENSFGKTPMLGRDSPDPFQWRKVTVSAPDRTLAAWIRPLLIDFADLSRNVATRHLYNATQYSLKRQYQNRALEDFLELTIK